MTEEQRSRNTIKQTQSQGNTHTVHKPKKDMKHTSTILYVHVVLYMLGLLILVIDNSTIYYLDEAENDIFTSLDLIGQPPTDSPKPKDFQITMI